MISSPRPYKPLSGRGPGGASRPNPVDRPLPARKPPAARVARPPKPKPLTDMQVAQQELAPVIGQITGAIQGQAQRAGDAVKGYTGSLAQQLAGIDYGAPYRQAVPQQAAVDEALRASLAEKGAELSQGLSSRLASLQEPGAVQPAAAAVAQFGQGTGNTQLAQGSAALSALLANQAAAGEYGAKQPGIAREAGLQGLGRVQGQALSDIASQTAPLYGKLPDIVASIQSNRAKQQQLGFENALAAREYGLKTKSTNAGIAQGWGRLSVEQQGLTLRAAVDQANIKLRGQSNDIAQQNADTAAYKATPAYRATLNAAAAAKKANAKLTPGQAATLAAKAAKDAEDLYHGVSHQTAKGQTIVDSYTQTYQDAIKTLLNRYPSLGRKGVVALVNSWYKPGEYGRPAPNPSITTGPTLEQAGR